MSDHPAASRPSNDPPRRQPGTPPSRGDRHRDREDEQVQRITSAPEGLTAEQNARFVRYAWQMGLRLLCFLLAFVTTGWVQWALLGAAIVLPYFAVVLANNRGVVNGEAVDAMVPADRQLTNGEPPATRSGTDARSHQGTVIVAGELTTGPDRPGPHGSTAAGHQGPHRHASGRPEDGGHPRGDRNR